LNSVHATAQTCGDESQAEGEAAGAKRRRKIDRLGPRPVVIRGKKFWQVDFGTITRDGRPYHQRRTFVDRQEALSFSWLKQIERENRGTLGINMPERLRGEAIEADQLLKPYGLSLLDAARECIERRELIARSETVGNAFESFLAVKSSDNLRPRYLQDLRYRLGRFSNHSGTARLQI
jgi:hypothetical protein